RGSWGGRCLRHLHRQRTQMVSRPPRTSGRIDRRRLRHWLGAHDHSHSEDDLDAWLRKYIFYLRYRARPSRGPAVVPAICTPARSSTGSFNQQARATRSHSIRTAAGAQRADVLDYVCDVCTDGGGWPDGNGATQAHRQGLSSRYHTGHFDWHHPASVDVCVDDRSNSQRTYASVLWLGL